MGIANRDKDASEKQYSVQNQWNIAADLVTGATVMAHIVSHPAKMKSAQFAALGVSGSPTYQVNALRWTSGGATVIPLGPAATVSADFGVSGSVVEQSSSLISLETGDVLHVITGGANSAALDLSCAIVLEALQDIKEEFGSQE